MKSLSVARLTAAFVAACAIVLPAFAGDPPDISGRWKFKTVLEGKGCVISGEIQFRKVAKPFDYACTFHSREDCDRNPPTFTEVDQSCLARVAGDEISITSKVEKITSAGPPEFAKGMMEFRNYHPDNFVVHHEKGDLVGLFYSVRQATVRFWRDLDLVS